MKTIPTTKQSNSKTQDSVEKVPTNNGITHAITGRFIEGHPKLGGIKQGGRWLSTQLEDMLFEKPEGGKETHAILLNKRVLKKSIVDGDMRAIELIYDRVEGAAIQQNRNLNVNIDIETKIDNKELDDLDNEYEEKVREIYARGNQHNTMVEEISDQE